MSNESPFKAVKHEPDISFPALKACWSIFTINRALIELHILFGISQGDMQEIFRLAFIGHAQETTRIGKKQKDGQ